MKGLCEVKNKMKTKTKEQTKTTQYIVSTKQAKVTQQQKTNEERQARWLQKAKEGRKAWQLAYDAKVKKQARPDPKPSEEMTIKEEDYWYRKQLREAMEDEDIFSYSW
jgi:hypothetical protein